MPLPKRAARRAGSAGVIRPLRTAIPSGLPIRSPRRPEGVFTKLPVSGEGGSGRVSVSGALARARRMAAEPMRPAPSALGGFTFGVPVGISCRKQESVPILR